MSRLVIPSTLTSPMLRSLPSSVLYRLLHRRYVTRFFDSADVLRAWSRLGMHCDLYCYVDPATRILFNPSNVTIGYGSCIAEHCELHAWEPITIGRCVFISAGAILLTGSHDIDSANFAGDRAPINIGDYAWIALDAFVMPGVTIGEGAVVGARAVVVKDVPPFAVVAGNPARVVRERKRQEFTYIPADWKRNPAWQQQIGIGF